MRDTIYGALFPVRLGVVDSVDLTPRQKALIRVESLIFLQANPVRILIEAQAWEDARSDEPP